MCEREVERERVCEREVDADVEVKVERGLQRVSGIRNEAKRKKKVIK